MNLKINADELEKIELKITTNNLKMSCERCGNEFYLSNIVNFNNQIRQTLENKLIYEAQKDEFYAPYAFECPFCTSPKIVPLNFKLQSEKRVLLYETKIEKK